jgi:hypothetical protein
VRGGAVSSCGFMSQIVGLVWAHGNKPLSVAEGNRVLAPFYTDVTERKSLYGEW